MRPRFFAITLFAMLLGANVSAIDYTIKEVIEVGEADFVPFLQPVIWSPHGTMLAYTTYTKGGVIKVSDTLGNVRDIITLDMPIHRWGWVSDSLIAVHMRRFTGNGPETEEELSLVDVSNNSKSVIHSFMIERNYREIPGKTTFSGPYKTVEGSPFYLATTFNAQGGKTVVERRSFLNNKAEDLVNNHLLRWGEDGLYSVTLDEMDSTWLTKRPFARMGYKQVLSSDSKFAMDGGHIFDLRDSSIIVLDTLLGEPPESTSVCGIVWFSFNPVAKEVLFTISCDDGHNYVNHRIATFGLEDSYIEVIDSQIGIFNCVAPSYSANGRQISFIAGNKIYILQRDVLN